MEDCLTVQNLGKSYRHFKALNGLTMHVPKGAIYGLVGKNGAGKTTLIRLICGLQQPTFGEYELYGCSYKSQEITKVRKRMGAVVETPSLYLGMTARENLKEQYRVLGLPSDAVIEDLLSVLWIFDSVKNNVRNFSLGMRQRLGIAVALCGDPDFLVLDEPVNGLDPQGIIEMRELILKLNRKRQITVLISSHILDELSRLATHYGFIDHGSMIKEISAEELEEACKKCIRIEVSDLSLLSRVLEEEGLEYKLLSGNQADIFDSVDITELVQKLAAVGCKVRSITKKDESLESYYVNLVGGGEYA